MSADDLFTREMWESVASDLRWWGSRWWRENEEALVGLTKDEMLDIAHALKAGNRREAKEALVARMSPEQWRAWRDQTTQQLEDLAARRAAALDALRKLGRITARVIGKALIAALL